MNQLPGWALNWKSEGMFAAESAMEDAAAHAETAMLEAERTLAEVEHNEKPPSEEEIQQVQQYANDPKAPPEWRELARRVDRGEFTWADLLAGRKDRDPGVLAALDASMRQAEREDGQDQDGGGTSGGASAVDARLVSGTPRSRRRSAPADEFEEDFSGQTYLVRDE